MYLLLQLKQAKQQSKKSFIPSETIAKKSKSFTDSQYVKGYVMKAAEILSVPPNSSFLKISVFQQIQRSNVWVTWQEIYSAILNEAVKCCGVSIAIDENTDVRTGCRFCRGLQLVGELLELAPVLKHCFDLFGETKLFVESNGRNEWWADSLSSVSYVCNWSF